jgi:hypothetical protein
MFSILETKQPGKNLAKNNNNPGQRNDRNVRLKPEQIEGNYIDLEQKYIEGNHIEKQNYSEEGSQTESTAQTLRVSRRPALLTILEIDSILTSIKKLQALKNKASLSSEEMIEKESLEDAEKSILDLRAGSLERDLFYSGHLTDLIKGLEKDLNNNIDLEFVERKKHQLLNKVIEDTIIYGESMSVLMFSKKKDDYGKDDTAALTNKKNLLFTERGVLSPLFQNRELLIMLNEYSNASYELYNEWFVKVCAVIAVHQKEVDEKYTKIIKRFNNITEDQTEMMQRLFPDNCKIEKRKRDWLIKFSNSISCREIFRRILHTRSFQRKK